MYKKIVIHRKGTTSVIVENTTTGCYFERNERDYLIKNPATPAPGVVHTYIVPIDVVETIFFYES